MTAVASPRIEGASRPHAGPHLREALLLAALCGLDLALFSTVSALLGRRPERGWEVVAFAVIGFAVLPLRHRAPVATFGLEWAHSLLTAVVLHAAYNPTIGLVLTLHRVAAHRSARVSVPALVAMTVPIGVTVYGITLLHRPWPAAAVSGLGFSALALGAWGSGRWLRWNTQRVERLERARAAAERDAVAAERRRVARELHDIVSHSVAVMVLQAAGAARIAGTDPGRAVESLHHIESAGIEAMAELRRMLGLLHCEEDTGGQPPCLGPQPSLGDLDMLLTSLAAAGMDVEVRRHGAAVPLDASVDLTAYRIIQESLTNVLSRCCDGMRPELELRWDPHVLLIRVHDDGRGRSDVAGPGLCTGNGIAGLKARSEAVGGRLSAGPRADGGYEVVATLPVARCED
jgi:signal transduction histidine kinase